MAEKLESEVEKIMEIGVEYLKKTGVPSSSAFFISPKGKFVVDPFDFRDKPKSKKLLKKMAKKYKAIMIITMAYALISQYEDTAAGPAYFRREVIFVYGETKSTNFGISQEFSLTENGKLKLGKKIIWPDGSEGPMTGYFVHR